MLWASKYRPTTFDECVGALTHLDYLKDTPMHLLLHSRGAGTGKTTLAHVLANELGYTLHTFNASSKKTRGIAFVEEELIPLTRSGIYNQIILLDEADQLTAEAQSALKAVIENAQGYFILTCNDITKVSQWIQSRCLNIAIEPMGKESMIGRLEYICGAEGVNITLSQLDLICEAHLGDLRNAINALQAFHSFENPVDAQKFILSLKETGFDASKFFGIAMDKDFQSAYDMMKGDTRTLVREVFDTCVLKLKFTNKLQVVDACITAERDILNGVNEDIVKANFVRMLMQ